MKKKSTPPLPKEQQVIVIGAGVAGLATAIRMACRGFQVKVFEKNSFPGGKLHHFEKDGFKFDAGPSLFTRPHLIEELFALAGEPIEPYFSYEKLPVSCHYFYEEGPMVKAYADSELLALELALKKPARPMLAIVGGAKVSSKLQVLESLAGIVDQLIVGGGIANTFLLAAGYPVGKSLVELDLVDTARALMQKTNIPLPVDVVVAKAFAADAQATVKLVGDVADDDMILDIGPQTATAFAAIIARMNTIIWNGPVGVFEFDSFAKGTEAIAHAVANNHGFSIAGGGETIAAIDKFEVTADISYISTGGGAFLEFVQGETLPAVQILEEVGARHAAG